MTRNRRRCRCQPVVLVLVAALLGGCGVAAAGGTADVAARPPSHRIARVWSLDDLPHPLSHPTALAVDRRGDLYVVDGGHDRIQVFDRDGRSLATWGGTGAGPGQFRFRRPDRCDDGDPASCTPDVGGGLAVDGAGDVYVADYGNARVQVFDRHGRLLTGWGGEGSGPGEFLLPLGVAVDGRGRVWVGDSANQRVQQFDRAGRFLAAWGRVADDPGGPWRPGALAVDGGGRLYVADHDHPRVWQLDGDGRRLAAWRWEGGAPEGLAVDAAGQLYVADGSRLLLFGGDGRPLAAWGGGGPGQGQFRRPVGVALTADGALYVADQAADRVAKYRQLRPGG